MIILKKKAFGANAPLRKHWRKAKPNLDANMEMIVRNKEECARIFLLFHPTSDMVSLDSTESEHMHHKTNNFGLVDEYLKS